MATLVEVVNVNTVIKGFELLRRTAPNLIAGEANVTASKILTFMQGKAPDDTGQYKAGIRMIADTHK